MRASQGRRAGHRRKGARQASSARRVAVVFGLAAIVAACGRQARSPRSLPARVAGCYALELAREGIPDDTLRRGGWAGLPSVVELDTVRVSGGATVDSAYRAHSYRGSRREDHPFNRWRGLASDSLRIYRSGAVAGFVLQALPGGADSTMTGTVRAFGDVVAVTDSPLERTVPVRLRARECPTGN